MKVDMVMPQMGESIAEATILKWRKASGERVNKDEIILEISTDKVDSEIPAPASGTLVQTLFNEGDVVPVKTKIAIIDTEGGAAAAPSAPASKPAAAPQPAPAAPRPAPAAPAHASDSNGHAHKSDRFVSPLVRSLAQQHGVSMSEVESISGSGHAGRVSKEDFMRYLETRGSSPSAPVTASATQTYAPPPSTATVSAPAIPAVTRSEIPSGSWNENEVEIVPMDGMRQAIADHMVRSKATSPHVYSVTEVDVSRISKWRQKVQDQFVAKEGFKLSFTPFFLEAAVKGLLEFPYINCSVDSKKIILRKRINLGCAVALGKTGLIVPVIKNAEEKNLVGIARALNDLGNRAKSKKLMPDEVQGGTFTVTNPGVFGTIIGYPIINQPQVAILSLGAIKKRAVVIDDMIAVREMVYLTLSYDHRIVDGSLGGSYLAFVKEYLESWDMDRKLY